MASKADIPSKTDFMKHSVFNFIESEKAHGEIQNRSQNLGHPKQASDVTLRSCSNSSTLSSSGDNEKTKYTTTSQSRYPEETEYICQINRTDVHVVPGKFSPKRYVTTCFLKPVNKPYWHSETLTLTLGSTKRRHQQHTFIKTILAPMHWSENMTTEIPDKERKTFKSTVDIPIEDSEFHYISLLPQQELAAAAMSRQLITQL